MTRSIFFRLLLLMITFGALLGLSMGNARATPINYLNRLEALGFYGSSAKFLQLGQFVCSAEARGQNHNVIVGLIIINTDEGIYSAEAEEIIQIANEELCAPGGFVA